MRGVVLVALLTLFLAACGPQASGDGMGMGDSGMMARHHAEIPEEYAGLVNPVPADAASLERGAQVYAVNCASCHGDGGMGDGPAGSALNPPPAPVAQTSRTMADDYLFWRISEGGTPFSTSMPPWKVLDEAARWDLVNYMRALGQGTARPSGGMGGAAPDPSAQAARQAELLAQAVEQGVLTQAEADTFSAVHRAMEEYLAAHPQLRNGGDSAAKREATVLAALVDAQAITQGQANSFPEIHNRLGASGLMP